MKDKIILITGSSSGIGAATAVLAADTYNIICIQYHTNEKGALEVAEKIKAKNKTAFIYKVDLTKEDEVTVMFKSIKDKFGRLDVLINNAGITLSQMKLVHMTADRIKNHFDTNVLSTLLCSREAIKLMSTKLAGQGGAIINVSSMAAVLGSANEYVDYAASKGAIDTFTIGLSKEIATEGIRVNAIRPGLIYTDLHAKAGEVNRVDRLKEMVPMKRGGQPEEVASAILWMASDEASYVTGSILNVSGGR